MDRYEEPDIYFADSSVFDMFSFELVTGTLENGLSNPFTAIISEQMAIKYFGSTNAVGKLITLEGEHSFRISAVVKNFPSNSHIQFGMFLPYDNMYDIEPDNLENIIRGNFKMNWMVSHSMTYVLLKEGTSSTTVDARFPDFIAEKIPENMQKGQAFKLQPLLDIHLNTDVQAPGVSTGSMSFIYIFIVVGAFTLLIASINFINLSTARSLQRTREIGMRKVLGAWKSNLIIQFLGESFLTTLASSIIAVIFAVLLLPELNSLTGKSIAASIVLNPMILGGAIILVLMTGLMAGLYPAFFVTRVSPIHSLKGLLSEKVRSGLSFRKGLIIIQFTISMILISGSLIIFEQLDLLKNMPLGFQKEHIINIPVQSQNLNNLFGAIDAGKRQKMNAFEAEISGLPGVIASTVSAGAPGFGIVNRNVIPEGFTVEDNMIAPVYSVDYDFIETYGIEVVFGREFSKEFGTDHLNAFMINEYAVKEYEFGSADQAIGKEINVEGKIGKVIGVVENFNFMPLNNPIGALILHVSTPSFSTFSIKIENQNIPATLSDIEATWNEIFPNETFTATFLDEQIDQNYLAQKQLADIVAYFSFLAIIISCMGSYGLIMFIAQQKMKEVGIRKVLGASVGQVVMLLSKRFVGLALVATVISIPFGLWVGDYWLENFSYRIEIKPYGFLLASIITMLMVLLTIGYQSIKTARSNPVNALRNE